MHAEQSPSESDRRSAMPESKTTAPRARQAGGEPAPKRKRIDWEAVERDYRTGRFTLRELEAKHGAGYAKISKRAKDNGWTKDLADAVRQATTAALIAEVATERATEGQKAATTVVLAAAELNKQVILGHRKHAINAREAMDAARAKLVALGDSVADIREAATFASAVESLSRTAKNVIEIERTAFGLDDPNKPPEKPAPVDFAAIPEGDRMAAYMRLVHGA
jgi:hypothetical protein